MNILSIQSWVAYGHVGNASAMFPLQRLGAEVHAIHTVQFSNHTGYGDWTGDIFSGAQVTALVDGMARRGALACCDAVLSGYMGDVGIGHAILDAVARVRGENPAALYCCDPVLGDDGHGIYVRPGIADFMRDQALPQADIATPNAFELRHLTGLPDTTLVQAKTAIAALQARMHPAGPRCVLLTSLRTVETPADCLDMLVGEGERFHLLRSPLLGLDINGAGDAIAALFLFHRRHSGSAVVALQEAGSAIHGVLRRTVEAGSRELQMVAAQEEFVRPSTRLVATKC